MKNTVWSTLVQGIKTLESNRIMRFTGENLNRLIRIIGIDEGMRVLEVGCGPGTFTRKLSERINNLHITGLDLDNNFIEYCKEQAKVNCISNVEYVVGNALKLPFKDKTFDICTSYTVIEHLPNKEFLAEQYRVCKTGGKVVAMNVRGEMVYKSEYNIEQCEREKELLKKLGASYKCYTEHVSVGDYATNPQNILNIFNEVGFKNVRLDVMSYVSCIDDSRNTLNQKKLIIESERTPIIESINLSIENNYNLLPKNELTELKELVNKRFDKRLQMVEYQKTLWDFKVSPVVIISGVKPC